MEKPVLVDEKSKPTDEIIKNYLGKTKSCWESFRILLETKLHNLEMKWNYYKDGKSWLCKVINKKKTVFWISIWQGYFRAGFYFTDKHISQIEKLEIDKKIKEDFHQQKNISKLKPLVIEIRSNLNLKDLEKVIEYKLSV